MGKKDKTQKAAGEETRPATPDPNSGDDATAKGPGADNTSAPGPAATPDHPHTTDDGPKDHAGGADTTAPPAAPASSDGRAQATADPGDTNSNDKVAGTGNSGDQEDQPETHLFRCRSQIRYAPPGERSKLYAPGTLIRLPGDIAEGLWAQGRIGDPD